MSDSLIDQLKTWEFIESNMIAIDDVLAALIEMNFYGYEVNIHNFELRKHFASITDLLIEAKSLFGPIHEQKTDYQFCLKCSLMDQTNLDDSGNHFHLIGEIHGDEFSGPSVEFKECFGPFAYSEPAELEVNWQDHLPEPYIADYGYC